MVGRVSQISSAELGKLQGNPDSLCSHVAASHDCHCCYSLFGLFKYNKKGQSPLTFKWLNEKWFCFLDHFQHCL